MQAACPQCGSKKYSFKRAQQGTEWLCKDCGFKKLNKSAIQYLKEAPLKGRLLSEIEKIEKRLEEKQ